MRPHVEAVAVVEGVGNHQLVKRGRLDDGRPEGVGPGDQDAAGRQEAFAGVGDRAQVMAEEGQDASQVGDHHVRALGSWTRVESSWKNWIRSARPLAAASSCATWIASDGSIA